MPPAARPISPRLKRRWRHEREALERSLASVGTMAHRARKMHGVVSDSLAGAERMESHCALYRAESDREHAIMGQALQLAAEVASKTATELRFQVEQLEASVGALEESQSELALCATKYSEVMEWLDQNTISTPQVPQRLAETDPSSPWRA
jgi:hypothetical protein